MSDTKSRPIGFPLSRRVVCAFLRAGRSSEPVTFERTMPLGELHGIRASHPRRPSWPAVFLKAIGLVAARHSELRQVVLDRPWTRLRELKSPVGAVTITKQHAGEEFVLLLPIKDPASATIEELDLRIRQACDAPIRSLSAFRLALRVAKLPLPLRCLATGVTNWVAEWRAKAFGTFGLSVTPQWGATALNLRSPWGCAFHYDRFESDGTLRVRLTFDHRLLDGHRACQILHDLEQTLNGLILDELRSQTARVTMSDTVVISARISGSQPVEMSVSPQFN